MSKKNLLVAGSGAALALLAIVPRGSFAIELVPGTIYSAWSRSPRDLRRRCRPVRV